MTETQQLLADYVRTGSEKAFRELVARYIDLVHSAALRLVNQDSHRAQDVTQTVFADLARMARGLPQDVMLGGWLHRHTCFVASKTMRGERRRIERERQAAEMQSEHDHGPENLAAIAPVLDEAIDELGPEDRVAVLLRFFERKDLKSVGVVLGVSEDAARKRVDRALSRLQSHLETRGVALSASCLGAALGAGVVNAAPLGMAALVCSGAMSGLSAIGATTQILGVLGMSKIKAGIVGVVAIAAVSVPILMQHQDNQRLRAENESLKSIHAAQISQLTSESTRLSNQLVKATASGAPSAREEDLSRELLRLRGEIGRLRQESVSVSAAARSQPSALSGLTQNPEAKKLLRTQQRMGMAAIFGKFSKNANLSKEQTEQLNDLLADNVMSNIDHIMALLKNGSSRQEMEAVLSGEEAALKEKVKALLGPEALTQYEEYTQNLCSSLSSDQFRGMLSGDKEKKDNQTRQLYEVMKEETRQALAASGLNPDFQTIPSLNFRNFVSEAEEEKSLALLKSIYDRVAARAGSFLSPEELTKFAEFSAAAIANNKAALLLNRKMMAPPGQ